MAFARLDLRNADPDTITHAVEAAARQIAANALVVLPTETVYGVAADPRRPLSVARLIAFKGRPTGQAFTHHISAREDVAHLAAPLSAPATRLAARYWPGPLTLVVPGVDGAEIGVRLPAHVFTRRVIAACGTSLYLSSVNRTGEAPLVAPDAIAAAFGGAIDLLCDTGPPPLQVSSTVVRVARGGIEVLREGILTREEVLTAASATVLFVCTGNTCRSPLAEVLARRLAADRLGVEPADVLTRGLRFVSAGLGAALGEPASEGAVQAAAEAGCRLDGHVAQPLTPELVRQAQRVFCMTASHLARLRNLVPDASDRATLLRPDGQDVEDPYGMSVPHYRAVRDEIARSLAARWREFAALLA